jgi:class 3 adenylate cyclase/tetratricopeptide (TPR) repeat protein
VTALFCDLVGSTTLGETHDPEVLRPLLDRYFAEVRSAVERHGGRVEKYIGDAVNAVFGLPTAHEDDALRAVRAAVEIQYRLTVLAAGAAIPLAARVGVDTGEVLVPGDGRPLIGDAMNVAARLQASAEPGSVLIGEPTYRLVRDAVVAEAVAPLTLKGKAEPVPAYRITAVASLSPMRTRRLDAPMVGRAREAALLAGAFERAASDRACVLFTVLGAAGAGKSRLVEEFLGALDPADATVLRGRCLSYGEGITHWPLAEMVRRAAGIDDADDAERARERLERFTAVLPEGTAIARGLAGLVGLEVGVAREELVWALRRSLEHLAGERPLVAVFDDLHWAEQALLDLVESVALLARHSPIFFLCEARPELLDDRPSWGGGKLNAMTIMLEPLAGGDTLELIDALVPGQALPPAVRDRVAEAAEGNPLYVHEFIGMLIDDGALGQEGWTGASDLASIAVPPTIHALLSARLDRLSADEHAVAERASVVGRSFDTPAVLAMFAVEARPMVPAALDSLTRKELIGPDLAGATWGQAFRFRHHLIRDAVYERLPKAERADLHERLAGWMDLSAGDRRSEIEEIVGYQLEQAYRYREELAPVDEDGRAVARRAAERLASAGRRAFERSDIAATVNLLGRAAALTEASDPIRLAVLPDLARALDSSGRFDDARACFAEALDQSRAVGDARALAYARVLQCLVFELEVTLEERHRVADECYAVFEQARDDRGLALCWRLRGAAMWRAGRGIGDEASLARALEHARRAGAHREEVLIADGLSASLALGPTPVPDGIRRCHAILRGAPDDRGIEMAMSHALAHLHARLGQFDLARPLATRCREIAAESGQRAEAAHLTEVVWDVETLAGDHEAAERIIAEGCAAFAAMGKPHPMLESFLALSQIALGRAVDVERLETMAADKRQATRALLEHAIAAAYLSSRRLAAAERCARSAVDYMAATDLITMHADASLQLGDILRAQGRHSEANEVFHRADDLYRRKGTLVGVAAVQERLAG